MDIVAAIKAGGAVSGIWAFLQAVPLGSILIPIIIITLIAAFSTTADTMSTTIAALCTKGARHDEEPALWQKVVWGVSIGAISAIMVAFGGGEQGVDGVKYLSRLRWFCGAGHLYFAGAGRREGLLYGQGNQKGHCGQ